MIDDLPKNIEIDGIIAVDQSIAQPDNLTPRYLRMLSAFVVRRSARGFTDDFQQANKGEVQLAIGIQVVAGLAGCHRDGFARVI